MQRVRKVLRRVLFVSVLTVSLVLIALSFAPRLLGFTPIGIEDDSMAPLLRRGDLALAKPVEFEQVQVGDMLTFYDAEEKGQFTRTVSEIWKDTQEFVTSSPTFDSPDPYTAPYIYTVGRVERTVRLAGYPSVWLHTTVGKVVAAFLLIIWIAVEIESFGVSKRREKDHA